MQHFLITGRAGSGKTHRALEIAFRKNKPVIIIRNIVQTRDIGFLPGDSSEKTAPFFSLYYPILKKVASMSVAALLSKKLLFFETTSFLRGVTYEDCTVVVDEAQNLTLHELETVLSRIGRGGSLIVVGDAEQMDVREYESGFDAFCQTFREIPNVKHFYLTENYRSELLDDYYSRKGKLGEVSFMEEGR